MSSDCNTFCIGPSKRSPPLTDTFNIWTRAGAVRSHGKAGSGLTSRG